MFSEALVSRYLRFVFLVATSAAHTNNNFVRQYGLYGSHGLKFASP
jgi:hypothetical protein